MLFNLQVTEAWLNQPILALVLVCHGSSRGVVRLLEGLSDTPTSVATVHNRLAAAAGCAATINAAQDLSPVRVGLHDEIFQGGRPVLTGLDADSTHCYLLAEAEHRDGDTFHIQQQCEGMANRLQQFSLWLNCRHSGLGCRNDGNGAIMRIAGPFARSEHPVRVGKSPAELMTGKPHPHWLELPGFEGFRRSPVPA